MKVVYTILGAMAGGYVTAWIAGEGRNHGLVLAVIQTLLLIWGMFFSELGEITPVWMRITLIVITAPSIILGARLRQRANQANAQLKKQNQT